MPAPDRTIAAMHVKILLPEEILLACDAVKVIAEAVNGSFALLPRHIDFVAPLNAGIVFIYGDDGRETVAGVDQGTLVKCGADVLISTRRAIIGSDLSSLRDTVDNSFRTLSEHEATTRTALARLEAGIIRRFIELDKP